MNKQNVSKGVTILVLLTRLDAKRGAADDEFIHDWCLPENLQGRAGILSGDKGVDGFWVQSDDTTEILVVLHGCEDFLAAENGAFQNAVKTALDNSGLNIQNAALFIFSHGRINEKRADLGMDEAYKPDCTELEKVFQPLWLGNYSLGREPAALAVPRILGKKGLPSKLLDMVKAQLKLQPAVDLAVRSMQHIILEMRLWCDLHFRNHSNGYSVESAFKECLTRIHNQDHWQSKAVGTVIKKCRIETLSELLKKPFCKLASILFESDSHKSQQLAAFTEKLGGLEFLKCENVFDNFIAEQQLPKKGPAQVDQCLRALSARLEVLIAIAAVEDQKRGDTNCREVAS